MRVLGVDPSLRSTGYAVVEGDRTRQKVVEYGLIRTKVGEPLEASLFHIAESLEAILSRHSPDCLSIEDIFTARNMRVALQLGHVRGAVILVCRMSGLPAAQYSATQIKETVAGYGRADKQQVQYMVTRTLTLSKVPPPDAADALAAALTHLFRQDAAANA
ncbi:MAG: crossover junction endodeoxyribonuclease RuvC [Deltaproteobacteria bacterium]|nr:crossover junction endodeoxyribonuclease RuvC [Deltaproteobacteria bacterium]